VPWIPATGEPPDDTLIVQCGVDPLYTRYPIRTHRTDLAITGSSALVFEALTEALEIRKGKIDPDRRQRIADLATKRRHERHALEKHQIESSSGINKAFMNWTLAQARPEGAIIVDEYWARADLLGSTLEGSEFHNPPSAGLGWGVPASLGVQLESPGQIVISTVGDGAYMFANPSACHQVMATNRLPVITVICNNGRWGAVQSSALGMYPDGHTADGGISPLAVLDQSHSFELYADATGGYGQRVEDRSEFKPALEKAIDVVRNEGRHVVLNVISED
jgi:acetolactate synthase-1/2/3 large subunit